MPAKIEITALLELLPKSIQTGSDFSKASGSMHAPVISVNQMRQRQYSICFVIRVNLKNAKALEQSIQSILRQTDPTWELLLCTSDGADDIVNAWLDIDWRIRCFPDISDGKKDLIRTALRATCDYMGFIIQGDVIKDDLVDIVLKNASSEPLADLIYTDKAYILKNDIIGEHFFKPDQSLKHSDSVNYLGSFIAMRKSLLLNTILDHTINSKDTEYSLFCNIASRAKKIIHIDGTI